MRFLQQGTTPVMLAAGKGHTGVVDLLVHKYNCSLAEVDKVGVLYILGYQPLYIVTDILSHPMNRLGEYVLTSLLHCAVMLYLIIHTQVLYAPVVCLHAGSPNVSFVFPCF